MKTVNLLDEENLNQKAEEIGRRKVLAAGFIAYAMINLFGILLVLVR